MKENAFFTGVLQPRLNMTDLQRFRVILDSAIFLFGALIMFKQLTSVDLFLREFHSPLRRKAASEKPEDSQNVSDSSLFNP